MLLATSSTLSSSLLNVGTNALNPSQSLFHRWLRKNLLVPCPQKTEEPPPPPQTQTRGERGAASDELGRDGPWWLRPESTKEAHSEPGGTAAYSVASWCEQANVICSPQPSCKKEGPRAHTALSPAEPTAVLPVGKH